MNKREKVGTHDLPNSITSICRSTITLLLFAGIPPRAMRKQALNPGFQADPNLCSVQQTFSKYKDPRGRLVGLWSLEVPPPVFNRTSPPAIGCVSATCPHKLLSSWSSSEVTITQPPLSQSASQGSVPPPAGPSCRPRASLL